VTYKGTLLLGKDEICDYVRRGWAKIEIWIKKKRFPAKKIDGVWQSDTVLIDEWFRRVISPK
jgi:hypothetical protein